MKTVKLESFFEVKSTDYCIDNFTNFEQKVSVSCDSESLKNFTKEKYDSINNFLSPHNHEWSIEIEEIDYTVSQKNYFELDIEEDNEFDELKIKLSIFKNRDTIIVLDEIAFFEYLENQTLQDILKLLGSWNRGVSIINNFSQNQFSTDFIGYNTNPSKRDNLDVQLSSQCNFYNLSEFKFSPEYFDIGLNEAGDKFIDVFDKLQFLFILIFLFDNSEIFGNEISLKISGHKTHRYKINFWDFDTSSKLHYNKIYKWVYSEISKIEDKLGIARNIISIYLNTGSLEIEESTFNSILSANQTYIKENISKYIDIRSRLHQQVEQVVSMVNKSLDQFFGNFQKSIFLFISFYLTVFVLKIYTKPDITSVMTKETTLLGIGLLIISFFFLLFSFWLLFLEKKRIKNKYEDVKSRALDLLIADDLNKILDNDKEYRAEISHLFKRAGIYSILWVLTILVFLIVLAYTSDFI